MSACLTDLELAALTREAAATPPTPAQQEHLLGCERCRGKLLSAFRERAHLTLPDHDSLDETAPVSSRAMADSGEVPSSSDRYGLRASAAAGPEVLGRGGYGKVLLARDLAVGRDVALKCLRSKVVASPQRALAEARLLREARVVGQLEHPAIVPLYDVGRTSQGQLFYTMRRIRGRTLAEAVAAAPDFTARLRLLPHVLAACHAVAYAHSRGVIHRDLKPQNVMVDRFGQTAVIDWGLASTRSSAGELDTPDQSDQSDALRLLGDESLSDGKGRLGTPAYMSPEQLAGVRGLIDETSDVWGLGALLFEVLTGRSPRESGPLSAPPPTVRSLLPECPTDLAALCDKALAESRDERYPSAEALAADLDAWLHGRPVTAHVYRPAELARRFVGEHRVALLVAAVSLSSVLVLGVGAFLRVREERNRAREFGLAMLADVVPRMTSLGDARFLTGLTGRVQEWLEAAGSGEDDAAVAHTWMQLAVNADYLAQSRDAERYATRCLLLARGLPSAHTRYALEQTCEAMRVDNTADLSQVAKAARIAELWRQPPPSDAIDDVLTVEARQRLAARRFLYANAVIDGADELATIRESIALSQRWEELSPEDPSARLAHVSSLIHATLAATNQRDGVAALNFSDEAVRRAREALRLSHSEQAVDGLSNALASDVATRRWYANDDAPTRAKLELEAREVQRALMLISNDSTPSLIGMMGLALESADLESLPAVLDKIEAEQLNNENDRTVWLYAMLGAGRSREALGHAAWLDNSDLLDSWVGFTLAAADVGDWKGAAKWARDGAKRTSSSVWMIDGLHRWATSKAGPGADVIQRFETAMAAAQKANDDAAIHQALLGLADDLDRLAAR
jgi:tRNA A-37 threonylcarbamoyl transferase component Bud32